MKFKIFILISLLLSLIIVSGCSTKTQSDIENKIIEANYCEVKENCVRVDSVCPFGCNVYVNTAKKDRINNLINTFQSDCTYRCFICQDVQCIDNKCEPLCE